MFDCNNLLTKFGSGFLVPDFGRWSRVLFLPTQIIEFLVVPQDGSVSFHPLSVWHILGKLETAEVLRDYVVSNPQMELI